MILEAEFIEEAEMKADFGSGFPIGGKADYSIVSNAIKGYAEGNPIAITDVSPLEHEMAVQLLEYVPDYDKRLLTGEYTRKFPSLGAHKIASIYTEDYDSTLDAVVITFEDGEQWEEFRINETAIVPYIQVGDVVYVDEKPNDATVYYGEKCMYKAKLIAASSENAALAVLGKNFCHNDWEIGFINTSTGLNQSNNNYVRTKDFFALDKDKTYFVSGINVTDSNTVGWYFYDENKAFIKRYVSPFNRTISVSGAQGTIPKETAFYRLAVNTSDTDIGVQIELGTTATEYEPYVEPKTYTADENGKVAVPSIYPTTTLSAENGVTITAEYNKDTNKVIESLVNAIISLGGNV